MGSFRAASAISSARTAATWSSTRLGHAGEALSNIALFLDGVAEDPLRQLSRENVPAEDRPQLREDLERLERVLVPVSDARGRAASSSAKVLHARYRQVLSQRRARHLTGRLPTSPDLSRIGRTPGGEADSGSSICAQFDL